jgi:hypothetical protein
MTVQSLVYGVAVAVGGIGTAVALLYVVTKIARAFGEDDVDQVDDERLRQRYDR